MQPARKQVNSAGKAKENETNKCCSGCLLGSKHSQQPSIRAAGYDERSAGRAACSLSNYRGRLSLLVTQGHWQCERHRLGLSGDDLVVGVDQLNPNLVLADRQTGDVDRIVVARVRPPPRQVG